jgi:hypothetical protein
MSEDSYQKLDIEYGLPIGKNTSSFFKIDGFLTKSQVLIEEKLKVVWLLQGGLIKPIGCNRIAINDRFFISNSLGYSHLGHSFPSSLPKSELNIA